MQTKDDIKGMAQTFREAADILDEIADLDDKEDMTPVSYTHLRAHET